MAVADLLNPAATPKKSDLRVRALSAIVMILVAGGALWLGGWVWTAFVALVGAGVLWEWVKLSRAMTNSLAGRLGWFVAGLIYVGVSTEVLWDQAAFILLMIILCVVATDVGAYFSGRGFGGPKIAPRISPSKTWAGLGGGMVAAGLVFWGCVAWVSRAMSLRKDAFVPPLHDLSSIFKLVLTGALVAVIAQSGDFLESWMKRRAGVKDSGSLIPGHGGLFDRVDGLLAVLFVAGIVMRLGQFL